MEKYRMVIYWSKEDDCFVGLVPDLRGCFADGKTREECFENTVQTMNEWLEDAKEMGWEIPKPSQPEAVAI